jgi:hypothetical protein
MSDLSQIGYVVAYLCGFVFLVVTAMVILSNLFVFVSWVLDPRRAWKQNTMVPLRVRAKS